MKPYYEHGGITIYHGDCREILPQLGKFDLLLTDPPYGIDAAGSGRDIKAQMVNLGGKRTRVAAKDYGHSSWDVEPPAEWIFGMLRECSQFQIIFGGNYFQLPPSRCWLVWDKDNGENTYADCELAWTNLDKAVRKIKWRWLGMLQEDMANKEHRVHPTQKPLPVMSWALSQAPQCVRTVIDPYMGSGTTLVACKAAGLEATGIEREEQYCEIAAQRLSQETLFGLQSENVPAETPMALEFL